MKRTIVILLALVLSVASAVCAMSENAAPVPTAEPVQMQMTDEEIAAMVIGIWENEDDRASYGTTVKYYDGSIDNFIAEPGYYVMTLRIRKYREDGTICLTVRCRKLIGEFESTEDAAAHADMCEYGDEVIIIDGDLGIYQVKKGYLRTEENEKNVVWLNPYHVICYDGDSFVTTIKYSDSFLLYERWLRWTE